MFVFSDTFFCKVLWIVSTLYLALIVKLPKTSLQTRWCFAVRGHRARAPWWPPPAQPSLAGRYQHRFCQEGRRLCTFTSRSLFNISVCSLRHWQGLGLVWNLPWRECWRGLGAKLGRRRRQCAPSQRDRGLLRLRLLECLTRQFFGRTSSHHSYFYFFHFCYIHIY